MAMSRPRYRWWGFARKMVRDYRTLKKDYDDLHTQSVTQSYTGIPRGGGNGRAVEAIAMRKLPDEDDQKVYEAVSSAIEATEALPDGEDRMKLIRYAYWCKKQHTVKDAALQVHVSRRTAERWHADFIRWVGKCYGFNVGGLEPKNCDRIVESK